MSYARVGSTGHYIYQDNNGDFYFDTTTVSGDTIDIFLCKLYTYRPEELKTRIEHGKQLCDEWESNLNKLEKFKTEYEYERISDKREK
jgi:hypothetical protein